MQEELPRPSSAKTVSPESSQAQTVHCVALTVARSSWDLGLAEFDADVGYWPSKISR